MTLMATMMLILNPKLTKKYPDEILRLSEHRRVAQLINLCGFLCFVN